MSKTVFRNISISPDVVLAGDSVEFIIHIEIGPNYTSGPSRLILDMPGTLGMSRATTNHIEDDGFVAVICDNPDVQWIRRIWDPNITDFSGCGKYRFRNQSGRYIVLDISAGLVDGDTFDVYWGHIDCGHGIGTKVTTVVPYPNYQAEIFVYYYESHEDGLPDLGRDFEGYSRPTPLEKKVLRFKVKPRGPETLRLIRRVDKACLQVRDRFRNIAESVDSMFTADGEPTLNSHGVFEFATPNVHVRSRSLQLCQSPGVQNVFNGYNLYFGDMHIHTALSNDCIERERLQVSPAQTLAAARDHACVDFTALTDHHQPWDEPRNRLTSQNWDETIDAVIATNEPGRFVAFSGFEFRCPRGDTAVILGEELPYSAIQKSDWTDIRAVWSGLAGTDFLTIPHFHNAGELPEGQWWYGPPHIEPSIEVFSCHGSYEQEHVRENGRADSKEFRRDRCAKWLLEKGHRYGLVANSDGHKGRPGGFGLTGVLARELTREAIFEAYRAGRVYATTNARFRVIFAANGKMMGAELAEVSMLEFHIEVISEQPLKCVELMRNANSHTRLNHKATRCVADVTIREEAPSWWYVRAIQTNGETAWSSPIWTNHAVARQRTCGLPEFATVARC